MVGDNDGLGQIITVGDEGLRCGRCHGRMIPDTYPNGVQSFWEWKCMSCGEVIDPLILSNRAKQNLHVDRDQRDSSQGGRSLGTIESQQ
jgi:hypothetical protein